MKEKINTVVVGGGQAGLSISYYLTQAGREHIILEKKQPVNAWKKERWDSFTLVTPNWTVQLPDFAYSADQPDGFMSRDEVITYLDLFTQKLNPPIRSGVEVTSVENTGSGEGFLVSTHPGDSIEAQNVVVATGTFQKPRLPGFGRDIATSILQLHTRQYRNPATLPPGAVLVVGSGQSGCQIAEELYQSGRKVYLSTSSVGRMPRRYRGRDWVWWMVKMGRAAQTVDQLPSPKARFIPAPHVSGKNGGHTLNLHQFARDGVTLLGRMQGAQDHHASFANDLQEHLDQADRFAQEFKKNVDQFIEKTGTSAPKEDQPPMRNGYALEPATELDLASAGIKTIIWATGYAFDYSLVGFPIFDEFGYPRQQRGVTSQPGLYFLGLNWLHTITSALLAGVGQDAAYLASQMQSRP